MAEEPKEEKKIDEPAAEPAKATAPAESAKPVSSAEFIATFNHNVTI